MFRFFYLALLSVCLVAPSVKADATSASKNPCKAQEAIKDEGFVIGLAFWRRGTVEDWGNSTAGFNPCSADAGDLVGVQVAAYEVKVDTIAVLRTDRATETALFDSVLSVVAFAGGVRSEARYIRSSDADITAGTGVLRNLVLIAEFDKGKLKFLRWQEQGCIGCSAARCLQTGIVYNQQPTFACAAVSTDACAGAGRAATLDADGNEEVFGCFTSFQVGTSGTDADAVVLNTGTQLQRIQSLSVTALYSDASTAVDSITRDTFG